MEQVEEGRRGRPCTAHRSSEIVGRPHRTGPCRLALMGPNFQTNVYEHLGEPHDDLWAQGTFGRDGPLRRQLLLQYHDILSSLSGLPVTAAGMVGWARKWAVARRANLGLRGPRLAALHPSQNQ